MGLKNLDFSDFLPVINPFYNLGLRIL